MGRDKGLIEIAGDPLIARTASVVKPLVASVTIVGEPERHGGFRLPVLADRDFGEKGRSGRSQGPLVGMLSALETTTSPWNLILACDLPYLTRVWLNWLLVRAMHSQAQILMPRTSGGLEPLAAVYRRECAAPIAAALARGVRKVTDALAELPIEVIDAEEWQEVDADGCVLTNMNTPEDLDKAQAWWETQTSSRVAMPKLRRRRETAPRRRKQ
jgi:molybdopterin-guanine dinucleotide biosynthesis protein A